MEIQTAATTRAHSHPYREQVSCVPGMHRSPRKVSLGKSAIQRARSRFSKMTREGRGLYSSAAGKPTTHFRVVQFEHCASLAAQPPRLSLVYMILALHSAGLVSQTGKTDGSKASCESEDLKLIPCRTSCSDLTCACNTQIPWGPVHYPYSSRCLRASCVTRRQFHLSCWWSLAVPEGPHPGVD